MKKPIIGITSAYEREVDLLDYHRTTVSIDYSKSIILSGGIPIILPVTQDRDVICQQLSMLDGLILSGGADINPFLYGQDFKEGIHTVSPERDTFEMIVLEEFLKTEKPILGICRGHQFLNVYFGGSLFQDLKYYGKETLQHHQTLHPDLATHRVEILEKDNLLAQLYGKEVAVNSFHHQGLDKIGDGLTVIARTKDGIVEAIQKKSHPFLYGIQWHPEMMTARGNMEMKKIFEKFIEACELK